MRQKATNRPGWMTLLLTIALSAGLVLPFAGLQVVMEDALAGRCNANEVIDFQWLPVPGQYCVTYRLDGSRDGRYALLA